MRTILWAYGVNTSTEDFFSSVKALLSICQRPRITCRRSSLTAPYPCFGYPFLFRITSDKGQTIVSIPYIRSSQLNHICHKPLCNSCSRCFLSLSRSMSILTEVNSMMILVVHIQIPKKTSINHVNWNESPSCDGWRNVLGILKFVKLDIPRLPSHHLYRETLLIVADQFEYVLIVLERKIHSSVLE